MGAARENGNCVNRKLGADTCAVPRAALCQAQDRAPYLRKVSFLGSIQGTVDSKPCDLIPKLNENNQTLIKQEEFSNSNLSSNMELCYP